MRNWLIGSALVIGGGLLVVILTVLGFALPVAKGIAIAVATAGFIIQMYAAFSLRASFVRERKRAQLARQAHAEVMERVKGLPPEQAIPLLQGHFAQLLQEQAALRPLGE